MATTAGLRPDHYCTLGLEPDASLEAIEQAFRRKLSGFTPHAFGSVAEASVAYETLRDPARRRAYDQAIGVAPPPPPPPSEDPAAFWNGRPYSMRAGRVVGARPLAAAMPASVPRADLPSAAQPPAAPPPRPAAFVAAPAPTPERVVAADPPAPDRFVQPEPVPEPEAVMLRIADDDDGGRDTRRAAWLAAGAVAAVAVIGAWLGTSGQREAPAATARTAEVVSKLPEPGPTGAGDVIALDPADTAARPVPLAAARAARRPPPNRARPAPATPPADEASGAAAVPRQSVPLAPAEPASEPAPAPAPAPETEPAPSSALPLSNRTIARTIERIGYPCGSVSGAAPSGQAGVFTVSCSSGHSYRAAPIGGRYRFKRL